jgi:hypothetical protein
MKRIKKVNETLKQLMKPKKLVRGSMAVIPQHSSLTDRSSMSITLTNPMRRKPQGNEQINEPQMSQDEYDKIIS